MLSPKTTFTLESVEGGQNNQSVSDASSEANLDIQYTVGLALGVPVTFISNGHVGGLQDLAIAFLDTAIFLDGVSNPPSVVTTSYAANEDLFTPTLAQ